MIRSTDANVARNERASERCFKYSLEHVEKNRDARGATSRAASSRARARPPARRRESAKSHSLVTRHHVYKISFAPPFKTLTRSTASRRAKSPPWR